MVPGEELTEEGPKTGGVTCVNFSPFFHRFFLAGCGDGSVRLYKVNKPGRIVLFYSRGEAVGLKRVGELI